MTWKELKEACNGMPDEADIFYGYFSEDHQVFTDFAACSVVVESGYDFYRSEGERKTWRILIK